MMSEEDFYLRYYVGHRGKYGHEFLEFELSPNNELKYSNNSHYKDELMIRKKMFVTDSVVSELKNIIEVSEIMKEDDNLWPYPDQDGKQELEIVLGNEHISFMTSKIGSLMNVQECKDPEGQTHFLTDFSSHLKW